MGLYTTTEKKRVSQDDIAITRYNRINLMEQLETSSSENKDSCLEIDIFI